MARPDDVAALERALDLGFNVALIGAPGAGTTSLLEHLAARRPSASRVNAADARSAAETLWAASRALGSEAGSPEQEASPRAGMHALRTAAGKHDRTPELLLDGLDPVVAHDLFGRMRDELWDVPVRWLLAMRPEDRPVALMAPANAFFEAQHELRPFTEREIAALLERRDGEKLLTDEQVATIGELADGVPGRALALARGVALHGPSALEQAETNPYERVAARLGDSAARVLRELDTAGPAGPSDDALLRRVRLSRPRAYEVFRALEDAGYVVRSHQPTGRQGRPPAVFASLNKG